MSDYNQVTLVGTIDSDIKFIHLNNNNIGQFILKTKNTENIVDETLFNIVCNGKLAEVCSNYLKKGKRCLIDGQIEIKHEKEKWITSIIAKNIKFL